MANDPLTHDCSNYPVTECDWCSRAWLVAQWWPVHDVFHDVVPLAALPFEILAAFLDFFDAIVERQAERAFVEDDKREVAELFDVAQLFIEELRRRGDGYQLERACVPGWMATQ
jgi:hypothetical protein